MIPKITPPGLLSLFTECVAKSIATPFVVYKLLLEVLAIPLSIAKAFDGMTPYFPDHECLNIDDVEYCDVKARDVLASGDALTVGEKIIQHKDLPRQMQVSRPTYDLFSRRDFPHYSANAPLQRRIPVAGYRGTITEHVVHLKDDTLVNPPDGAVVYRDDAFFLSLFSFYSQKDPHSWVFFSATGAVVKQYAKKSKDDPEGRRGQRATWEKFRVHLTPNADVGHVQFFQAASGGARYSTRTYPWGTLLNLYVYRTTKEKGAKRCYPAILPVVPDARQNFVPLLPQQKMQLIVPEQYNVTFNSGHGEVPPLHYALKTESHFPGFRCNYFNCRRPIEGQPQLIFFDAKDCPRQGTVIIPPIQPTEDGDYAILHEPMDDVRVYCNNIDGFILRSQEDRFRVEQRRATWLDCGRSLLIESGYKLNVPNTGYEAYDLRVRIMDKTKPIIRIRNLFSSNGCQTV